MEKICRKASSFLIFQWPLKQRFNYHLKYGLNVHHKEEKLSKCSFLIDNLTAPLLTELNRNLHSYSTCGHKSFNDQLQHHSYSRKKALKDVSMLEMRSSNHFTGWDWSFISDINSQCWIHREKGEQTERGSRRLKPRLFGVPIKRLFCSCSRIWRYKLLSWAREKLLKLLELDQNINHSSPWDSFGKAGLASTVASIDTILHGSSKSCQVLTLERKAVIILLYSWGKCIPLK